MSERLPLRVLVPLAVVLLLVWAFGELADEVIEGSTRAVDEWILLGLRTEDPSDPVGPRWFEEMARDVTALGGTAVLGLFVAIVAGYLVLSGRIRLAALTVGWIVLGFVSIQLLKIGFARPRPELVPHQQEVYTASFPSGHAMAAALTFVTLAALLARTQRRRRVQAWLLGTALLLTVLVGVSRVYLGVHYPTDVLGGWAVGSAWAVLAWLAASRLSTTGEVEA